jgi:cellulose synthase/poly-beta-1,6-N-acetylglucosamine synthase-like glycosyltransferase
MELLAVVVFITAFCLLLYILFGYPLLLRWIAEHHEQPVRKDGPLRTVSIVIAVRNGEQFLDSKIHSILALNYPRQLIEILVVSDGSEDRTDEIARTFATDGVRFLRVEHGGKAAALNAAVPLASNEIILFNDVRQTLDADCLRNAVPCFGDPKVGAVTAATFIRAGETEEEYSTTLYWRYELWMRMQMTRIDSTFGCTGAFYAIRRELWTPFPADTLLDDVYLPLTAFFQGYRIVLEPTSKIYDYPTALNSEFRRKVRLQAGLYQMLQLMPELLTSRNRMRLHFLSGKYGRLLVPYCMIAIALATFGLPPLWRVFSAVGQIFFYGAAAIDPMVPSGSALKRLTSTIRTFVVLMAASLAGVRVFFVPPRRLWKEAKFRVS